MKPVAILRVGEDAWELAEECLRDELDTESGKV